MKAVWLFGVLLIARILILLGRDYRSGDSMAIEDPEGKFPGDVWG